MITIQQFRCNECEKASKRDSRISSHSSRYSRLDPGNKTWIEKKQKQLSIATDRQLQSRPISNQFNVYFIHLLIIYSSIRFCNRFWIMLIIAFFLYTWRMDHLVLSNILSLFISCWVFPVQLKLENETKSGFETFGPFYSESIGESGSDLRPLMI